MAVTKLLFILSLACMAAILAATLRAEPEEITPVSRWAGMAGKVGSGSGGYICGDAGLSRFWQNWQIEKPKPNIDFSKELAVFYMGAGGLHLMSLSLDEHGNLVAEYVEAPTVSRYPNYLIFTVPRGDVRSLNGTPIRCAE